jgi:hypothetical protein
VLVLAPTGRDATLTEAMFARAGVPCHCCSSPQQLCAELDVGASAVLLAEEVVGQEEPDCLSAWLARQPPWSDLPVLVLARPGADSAPWRAPWTCWATSRCWSGPRAWRRW